MKAKTLHILYAKKLKIVQNQEKSLWCILNYYESIEHGDFDYCRENYTHWLPDYSIFKHFFSFFTSVILA